MSPETSVDLLPEPILRELAAAEPANVVVAVHAVNQAREVGGLLDRLAAGLDPGWAGHAAVLVTDGGSQDGTADALRQWCESGAPGVGRHRIDVGTPVSRGRAILGLLLAAHRVGGRAVALIDADLTGFRPEWVQALVGPVLRDEADYVSPAYARAPSEGTLTANLLAPLTGALYGARLQQVIGSCAGVAGPLPEEWLKGAGGPTGDWYAHGAELWLTTAALAARARIAEVALGRKAMTPAAPQPDLATILVRTVGPLFSLMERYQAAWQDLEDPLAVARPGPPPAVLPDAASPSLEQMVRAFEIGLKDLLPVWEQIMSEPTLALLYPLALAVPDEFRFPAPLWARVVGDFAVAYHERRLPREHLLRALAPLYLGRVAAFLRETRGAPPSRAAAALETIDRAFEAEKDRLVARWR